MEKTGNRMYLPVRVTFLSTLLLVVLSSCATLDNIDPSSERGFEGQEPLREATGERAPAHPESSYDSSINPGAGPVILETPQSPRTTGTVSGGASSVEGRLSGSAITVNFNQIPLPAFINEIFSKQLGLSYTIDPRLNEQTDLVTLNLAKPLSPADLYRTARMVLADYGISIRESGETIRFVPDKDASGSAVPMMISGRSLPEVPPGHRPVFSIVPLAVVRNAQVTKWVKELFKGKELQTFEDPERNAVLVKGTAELVRQAVDAIRLLDRPVMKGRHARAISPAFMKVKELSGALVKVLTAEGYGASESPPYGSIIVLPLVEANRIVVFAGDESILDHVIEWAVTLDQRHQQEIAAGVFSYEVQNVQAGQIAELLSRLEGKGGGQRRAGKTGNNEDGSDSGPVAVSVSSTRIAGGSLVVDENLNLLYFKGTGKAWLDLLPVIRKMDQPIPSVLLEVLLAEVTLNDQEDSGVEWLFRSKGIKGTNLTTSTLGGLDLGGSGLTLTFESAGMTRAVINAFYRNSRAVIRSSPRILVKSGEDASIEVGNDIPIITSNSQSIEGAGTPVIQTIQYRKTGVLLKVKPIVQASGHVDIEISQELSEQQFTTASPTGSPIILTRKLETTLSLRDGGSVLLGGLISTSETEGESGIPVLGKIPLMGKLFRTNTVKEDRTELLILVVPYVIRSQQDAVDLTEAFRQRLSSE